MAEIRLVGLGGGLLVKDVGGSRGVGVGVEEKED